MALSLSVSSNAKTRCRGRMMSLPAYRFPRRWGLPITRRSSLYGPGPGKPGKEEREGSRSRGYCLAAQQKKPWALLLFPSLALLLPPSLLANLTPSFSPLLQGPPRRLL
jgi:hypothetical protein